MKFTTTTQGHVTSLTDPRGHELGFYVHRTDGRFAVYVTGARSAVMPEAPAGECVSSEPRAIAVIVRHAMAHADV
jgi:hypothetical protein